jgi:hypothetical protein
VKLVLRRRRLKDVLAAWVDHRQTSATKVTEMAMGWALLVMPKDEPMAWATATGLALPKAMVLAMG